MGKIPIEYINLFDVTVVIFKYITSDLTSQLNSFQTRSSVDWACVAHLLFCFEET